MKLWWYKCTDALSRLLIQIQRILPRQKDTSEERWLKIVILSSIGILILVTVSGFLAFSLVLQGAEQTVVPDVRGKELTDALLVLQDRELYPRVQLRFSSDPSLKGKVVDQRPSAGTVVRAGKRITLTVSKGSVVDKVEDFRGKKLEEVRAHLQSLFASQKPLLRIKEPVTYVFHPSPAGTILEQKPEPGTDLTGLTDLVLVVSRGPEVEKKKAPNLIGRPYQEAMDLLVKEQIPFVFQIQPKTDGKRAGRIVEQTPKAGEEIEPGTSIEVTMTEPSTPQEGFQFGLFDYTLPSYPVVVDLKVEAVSPGGERTLLFSMQHPGGRIAFPYLQPENTTLVLSVFDREIIRHLVQGKGQSD
ncbi:MAG: PASTA domain-containing protein [Spirochaetales bacterium]